MSTTEKTQLDLNKIRNDFPILKQTINGHPLVYMDNAATSQKPNTVIESISNYYSEYNSNVHRGVHTLSQRATDLFEKSRESVSHFISSTSSANIIWTRNTTESLNLVARTWGEENISAGDNIVLTSMEHHSNLLPWQKLAKDKKAELRFISVLKDGTLDLNQAESLITDKTKLVSIVHTSNSLGTINPVKLIGEIAHNHGAKILVDGAQSVPHEPVSVIDLDCDFLAFSSHKMLGPTGIGVLYVKNSILENMEPFFRGGEMVLQATLKDATWNELPMRFEAGTPNIADVIGFDAAIEYLNKIGMSNIHQHEKSLVGYALKQFKKLDNITVYGPEDPEKRGGIISFYSENLHPHDIGTFLDSYGIAVRTGHHCTMPLMQILGVPATARASLYLYNTTTEVDILVDTLQEAINYFTNAKR